MAFAYEYSASSAVSSSSRQHARGGNGGTTNQRQHQQCPICLGQLNQPVISTCCGHQFCSQCVRMLPQQDRCPYCRSDRFSARPVAPPVVTAAVNSQRSQARPRRQQQQQHGYRCHANGCGFAGPGDAFLTHLISCHGDHVLANHQLMFQHHPHREPQQARHHRQPEAAPAAAAAAAAVTLIPETRRLGENQKMYCGGPLEAGLEVSELEGHPCPCCDNTVCGPAEGCNCVACMTLDLLNFNVTNGNSLVNKYGRVASRSSETGKFYCTAILSVPEEPDDQLTYCGPIEGPNCAACAALDGQSWNRYAGLM